MRLEVHQAQGKVLALVCGAKISLAGRTRRGRQTQRPSTKLCQGPAPRPIHSRGERSRGVLVAGTAGREREQIVAKAGAELDGAVDRLQRLRCSLSPRRSL